MLLRAWTLAIVGAAASSTVDVLVTRNAAPSALVATDPEWTTERVEQRRVALVGEQAVPQTQPQPAQWQSLTADVVHTLTKQTVVAQETGRNQMFLAGKYCTAPATGTCGVVPGVSYDRHDIFGDTDPYNPSVVILYNKTTDRTGAECCGWCSGYANCTAWTICAGCKAPFTDRCFLKTSTAGKTQHSGAISGVRAGTRPAPAPPPQDEANCIPWSLDPHNTNGTGFYWSANTCSMVLSSNDTLVAFLVGAKYGAGFHHQTDLIIRRSFDKVVFLTIAIGRMISRDLTGRVLTSCLLPCTGEDVGSVPDALLPERILS